ncbi:MAG: IS30 family transposase, partial [Acidimicrobiia bacterium]|nr:IS30 family transposase [Acidimicrobiia bacterium]
MGAAAGRPGDDNGAGVERNGGRVGYRATAAQRATRVRAARPKVRKLVADVALA